ncbi:hypothetical protein GCM10010472_01450 [Pseudonocardia halophobica]|uniref:Uncharacterized protein n=1 Tax=Pseudonocardia halophobica TaxID=29401 RepID=A0A9W6L0E1_9PSEU|nr:hypothetical protein GCM10017577_16250 [Pseudonocardia halophobica]
MVLTSERDNTNGPEKAHEEPEDDESAHGTTLTPSVPTALPPLADLWTTPSRKCVHDCKRQRLACRALSACHILAAQGLRTRAAVFVHCSRYR